ncbi:MAG: amino acid adenylation domain-containing protein, partial [bacterium]|nr:amino acid adenylation domain-containing protein [bacterium]
MPLDPAYPKARLAAMMETSRLLVLLTQEHLRSQLPDTAAKVIFSKGWQGQTTQAVGRTTNRSVKVPPSSNVKKFALVCPSPQADTLAYVIHTSGSTGRPKAVMISHRTLASRLLWMQEVYRLSPADRVLAKATPGFDVAIWEVLWPLLTGAQVVLARPGGEKDSAYLVRTIAERGVSLAHFVPSMLQIFLEEPGLESCAALRRVLSGGEPLPVAIRERFSQRLAAELHNQYGMTEGSIDATFHLGAGPQNLGNTIPIGRPYGDTRIHLLDARLRPVPPGAYGEVHVGGGGPARGYLGNPQATAERFVPDPLSGDPLSGDPWSEPGGRLYRTGDLARYLADGALDFLGRVDHQIKLRGIRIEPGEIEATLEAHPQVRKAVALVRQ